MHARAASVQARETGAAQGPVSQAAWPLANAVDGSPAMAAQRLRLRSAFGEGAAAQRQVAQRVQTVLVRVGDRWVELSTNRRAQALQVVAQFAQEGNVDGLRDIVAGFRDFAAPDRAVAKAIVDAAMEPLDYLDAGVRDERRGIQDHVAEVRAGLARVQVLLGNQRGAAPEEMQGDVDEILADAARLVQVGAGIETYVAGPGRAIGTLSGTGAKQEASRQYIIQSHDYAELVASYGAILGLAGDFGRRIWGRVRDRARRLNEGMVAALVAKYSNATEARLLFYDGLLAAPPSALYTEDVLQDLVFRADVSQAHIDLVAQLPGIEPARVLAFMARQPARFVADAPRWNQVAVAVNHAATFNAVFTAEAYAPRAAEVLAIAQAAAVTTARRLVAALGRNQANFARIHNHVAELEFIAGRLNGAVQIDTLCASDAFLANLADLHALFQDTPRLDGGVLLAASANNLAALHANRVALNRALDGEAGLTAARLENVLAHIAGNNALPAAPADLDRELVAAQSLGAELRAVMLTPLGNAENAQYLDNLARSVDRQAGVVWGSRGGTFDNGEGGGDFGAPVHVPVSVRGFELTNHAIAHLIDPRDAAHRLTLSNIYTAIGNHAGMVNNGGGYRDAYQGDGMRMYTPVGVQRIITIFFA